MKQALLLPDPVGVDIVEEKFWSSHPSRTPALKDELRVDRRMVFFTFNKLCTQALSEDGKWALH